MIAFFMTTYDSPGMCNFISAFMNSDFIVGNLCLSILKALMPITFSSPRAQPEVVLFLVSNESPYFSHYNPKISASNSLYFGSYSRKCTY